MRLIKRTGTKIKALVKKTVRRLDRQNQRPNIMVIALVTVDLLIVAVVNQKSHLSHPPRQVKTSLHERTGTSRSMNANIILWILMEMSSRYLINRPAYWKTFRNGVVVKASGQRKEILKEGEIGISRVVATRALAEVTLKRRDGRKNRLSKEEE